jgi:hypothetical protein
LQLNLKTLENLQHKMFPDFCLNHQTESMKNLARDKKIHVFLALISLNCRSFFARYQFYDNFSPISLPPNHKLMSIFFPHRSALFSSHPRENICHLPIEIA